MLFHMNSKEARELMNGVVDSIDIDAIADRVKNNDVDYQQLFDVLSQLLSQQEIEKLVENAKAVAEAKNGEPITSSDISSVLNGVVDVRKIQKKVADGDVDIKAMQNALPNLMGEGKASALLRKTQDLTSQIMHR